MSSSNIRLLPEQRVLAWVERYLCLKLQRHNHADGESGYWYSNQYQYTDFHMVLANMPEHIRELVTLTAFDADELVGHSYLHWSANKSKW